MRVNMDGVFLGTKFGIDVMKRAQGGSIINLSSIRALAGDAYSAAYDASKGGVLSLTRSAALLCAEKGYGIRVNSLHPGYVLTDMFRGATAHFPNKDELLQQAVDLHPIGRLGEAREIANAALFLASDESSFMVGAGLVVDGGLTAR